MTVLGLDHVNLRTADPARTLAFFRDVLAMKIGPLPGGIAGAGGGWVYDAGDRPVVHVGSITSPYPTDSQLPFAGGRGGGAVHHVALACSDFEGVKRRLQDLGVTFVEGGYAPIRLRQLFVADPDGVLLELNFRDEDA